MKKFFSVLGIVCVCATALLTAVTLILGKKEEVNLLYVTPAGVGVAALERKEGAVKGLRRLKFFQLNMIVFVLAFIAMTVMNFGRIAALWTLLGFAALTTLGWLQNSRNGEY